MKRKGWLLLVVTALLILIPMITWAQSPFFKGKTIRIIVGVSAGGGYDTYARVIARHMARHIEGNPAIIVENMPGAGSLIATNYAYKVAKPDGLTITSSFGSLILGQILGQQGIEFDARKFEYVGAPAQDTIVCLLSKSTGLTDVDKWLASKTPVKLGGIVTGNYSTDNSARIAQTVLGLPIHLVTGYPGSAEIRLAVESGELGGTFLGWESARTTWRKVVEAGNVQIVMQACPKPMYDLPKVPLMMSFAKTDEARKMIQLGLHDCALFARPYVLPPGTPPDRVQLLRKAFQETLQDKELLEETGKAKLDINPVTAEELTKTVEGLFKLDPALLAKFKDIIYQ